MALKEVAMYTVVCDGCGKDAGEGAEIVAWSDRDGALETADYSDWSVHRADGRHLCDECSFKENDDAE